jgi:hypothetical protein
VARAAERLDVSKALLAKVLGVSPPTVTRLYNGSYQLDDPNRKEWDFALLFVRVFRSLDSIVGDEAYRAQMAQQRKPGPATPSRLNSFATLKGWSVSFNTWTPAAVSSEAFDLGRARCGAWWKHATHGIHHEDRGQQRRARLAGVLAGRQQTRPTRPPRCRGWTTCWPHHFGMTPCVAAPGFRAVTDPGRVLRSRVGHAPPVQSWATGAGGFLKDAVDLDKLQPVAHTAFSAAQSAPRVIDVRLPPFSAQSRCLVTPHRLQRHPRPWPRSHAQLGWVASTTPRCVTRSPAWCLALLDAKSVCQTQAQPLDANLVAGRASRCTVILAARQRLHDVCCGNVGMRTPPTNAPHHTGHCILHSL